MERKLKANRLLAENVRSLLEARHIDQTALAVWCGHGPTWISKILNGGNDFRVKDLGRVADFFGLTVSDLFQPGISMKTERRGQSRRQRERRTRERRTRDRRTPKETAERGFHPDVRPPFPHPKPNGSDSDMQP